LYLRPGFYSRKYGTCDGDDDDDVDDDDDESDFKIIRIELRRKIFRQLFVKRLLSYCCLSCLSVLTVTLVYCGQTVGLIKMKLDMQLGLGSGHIVLD